MWQQNFVRLWYESDKRTDLAEEQQCKREHWGRFPTERLWTCSTVQTSIENCWYSWEGRKVWVRLLLLLRKCMLGYRKNWRGKIWAPGAYVSRLCHTLLWLFQMRLLFFFRPEGKKKLPSPAVMLRHWLRNRTWLQQMQKHFFTELCIWTWTEDDSLWLCSFWTNYTALWRCHCTRYLCPAIVCHGYNVQQGSEYIKVSGRWGF